MKILKPFPKILAFISLGISPLLAQEKYLILAEGNYWKPMMADNFIKNHKSINALPFSGFIMVGNTYTNITMQQGVKLEYKTVWNEVKGVQNLYPKKHNFMQINIDFPGDFWDDKVWKEVSKNFAVVAKVAKDLNFTGIVFDDEPYNVNAHKMNNFKFPNKDEINRNSKTWEIKGSEASWVDKKAYRNPLYNFQEHMKKVTQRFENIMQNMTSVFPNLTLLVYNGPSFSHVNSNKVNILVTDVGLPREHEYKGAIFTGLKQGLNNYASLHDMGESYKYRTDKHFKRAYQWRKYDIAKDSSNRLNPNYQWIIPKEQRASWSKDIQVGFMVFNKGQESNYKEYDTRNKSTLYDIKETLQKALKYSDKYVIYYAQDQDWLLPNQQYPLKTGWRTMIQELE
jgi:hypothetical protein